MGAPFSSRPRMLARSKRKPSTLYSVTQYLRHSTIISWTMGWLQLRVLPQPLKL